jgi:hypothetical protein
MIPNTSAALNHRSSEVVLIIRLIKPLPQEAPAAVATTHTQAQKSKLVPRRRRRGRRARPSSKAGRAHSAAARQATRSLVASADSNQFVSRRENSDIITMMIVISRSVHLFAIVVSQLKRPSASVAARVYRPARRRRGSAAPSIGLGRSVVGNVFCVSRRSLSLSRLTYRVTRMSAR